MENTELNDKLREIKRALYGMMNGPISMSMRQKGLTYKVNFGVELVRLQNYAQELPKDFDLAVALWKEDIRECRLLASMLMPHEQFTQDICELWVEQMRFMEEADGVVYHLLGNMSYASELAFRWLADERSMFRYVGYAVLSRLFAQRLIPNRRDMEEFLDQCELSLQSEDLKEKKAAYKALLKFMDLGVGQERIGSRLLDSLGM